MTLEDFGDRAGRGSVPETQEFTLNALVTPAWVLRGHPHDGAGEFIRNGRSSGAAVRIRPVGHEAPVPAKQCFWANTECRPSFTWQETAQRCKPDPIAVLEVRSRLSTAKDRELVSQHQDLDLLRSAAPEHENGERQHPTDDEIEERL